MDSGDPLGITSRSVPEPRVLPDGRRFRSILEGRRGQPAAGEPGVSDGWTGRQRLMARLEARMWQSGGPAGAGMLWRDPLPGAADRRDNPGIPSGYTYLLQLIAHDVVDSVRTVSAGTGTTLVNGCQRPLMLDTIYGMGPDRTPHAYDLAGSDRDIPRTLLRLGGLSERGGPPRPPERRRLCPFRDIARTSPGTAGGPTPGARPPAAADWSEPLIADGRNDAHALISQITVLFHLLHNAVMAMVPAPSGLGLPKHEIAWRRFLCARAVVTVIYRNIVEKDVLPRILDPRVLEAFRNDRGLQLGDGFPTLEFATGAFRFGHAIVRDGYRPNRGVAAGGLRFSDAREQSSRRNRGNVPVSPAWAVDWSLFFDSGEDDVNLSRRIGPFHSGALMQEGRRLPGQDALELVGRGLPNRDMAAAAASRLAPVAELVRAIRRWRRGALRDVLPDYDVWRRPLRVWLEDAGRSVLSAEDVEHIVGDPPLPFFVLFEAAHDGDRAGRPLPAAPDAAGHVVFPGGGGRCLGPLGSIIVADTLFGALRGRPFGFDEIGLPLPERIRAVSAAVLGEPSAMDVLTTGPGGAARPLDTMPDLLALLEETGAFAPGG